MISIGITICDKDFQLLDTLLSQIKERVKVPHEVIIIDNREQYINIKTVWQPTYQFGYNAYQFNARAKIIELAKGEYIWFIDGDDEIGYVDNLDFNEDIIVFSYTSYPVGEVHIQSQLITESIFSNETSILVRPVLWNKFIKRKLFTVKFPELKIVTNEDVLWFYSALKNAESIRITDKIIYHHNQGISNKQNTFSYENLLHLVTGYNEMKGLLKELLGEDFYSQSIRYTNEHILSFIPKLDNIKKGVQLISQLISAEDVKKSLSTIHYNISTEENYQSVFKALQSVFGEDFPYFYITNTITYPDGRTEEKTFKKTVVFN